jgi:protein SCO1/2
MTSTSSSCCSCGQSATAPTARHAIGGSFSLIDHHGTAVTHDTYRGRLVLIFFGFTHCAVVCPRALRRIHDALDRLGGLASDKVVALYISVDPERDTPEVMKNYLAGFNQAIVGLTGSRDQVEDVLSKYKIFARRVADSSAPDGYVVPHTAISYLLDENGNYLDHLLDSIAAEALAQRLREHLTGAGESLSGGST